MLSKMLITTTYLLLLLVVPSSSMNYLSSMPFAGSQLCSWRMMTCQKMTGIMDYVRITCEKGIKIKKNGINQSHSPPPVSSAATDCVVDLPFTLLASSQLCC